MAILLIALLTAGETECGRALTRPSPIVAGTEGEYYYDTSIKLIKGYVSADFLDSKASGPRRRMLDDEHCTPDAGVYHNGDDHNCITPSPDGF